MGRVSICMTMALLKKVRITLAAMTVVSVFLMGIVSLNAQTNSHGVFWDAPSFRNQLEQKGVTISVQSISDMFGNTMGGIGKGGAYAGLLTFGTDVDLEKAFGWEGASFNSTWFWSYGNNLTTKYIGNPLFVTGIAVNPSFRCYQLSFEQQFFQGAFSIEAGELALNREFCIAQTAEIFINNTFAVPALFLGNFPNGGPIYPMATPGIRLALHPYSWLTIRSALAQANPFSQESNPNNFNWNFGPAGGLLSFNEVETTWNAEPDSKGLTGVGRAGFWIQTGESPPTPPPGQFVYGAPSANPYGTGFYGIIDQQLTNPGHMENSQQADSYTALPYTKVGQKKTVFKEGLSMFCRVGFSPQQTSVVSLYADGGFVYTGLFPGRKKDKLGLAFAYAKMGPDSVSQAGAAGLKGASFESVAELSYSWIISKSMTIQPDIEYIMHPNGTEQYGNALVVGVQAVVNF